MHRWAIAGVIDTPVVWNLSDFVHEGVAARVPTKPAPFRRYGQTVPFMHGLSICRAEHSQGIPLRSQVGVAVFDGKRLVATVVVNFLWVHPDYRGRGLAPEMVAELYAAWPELIAFRKSYTPAGRRNDERAYTLLVARGAVVEPLEATG